MMKRSYYTLEKKFKISIDHAAILEEIEQLICDAVESQIEHDAWNYELDGDAIVYEGRYKQEVECLEFWATEEEPGETITNRIDLNEDYTRDYIAEHIGEKLKNRILMDLEETEI